MRQASGQFVETTLTEITESFTHFNAGSNFLAYEYVYGSTTERNQIRLIKNGSPLSTVFSSPNGYLAKGRQYIGAYTYITQNNYRNFRVHRVINDNVTGKLKDYPVSYVSLDERGNAPYELIYTSYAFDSTNATYEPTGTLAQYNKCRTVQGSNVTTDISSAGYTDTYFFNGLSRPFLFLQTKLILLMRKLIINI